MSHKDFKFELDQRVRINVSGEQGDVIARIQYVNAESAYQIRYKRTNGTGTKVFWTESDLSAVE